MTVGLLSYRGGNEIATSFGGRTRNDKGGCHYEESRLHRDDVVISVVGGEDGILRSLRSIRMTKMKGSFRMTKSEGIVQEVAC